MSAKPDFWGEVAVIGGVTPVAILREQAALLGGKTQNLVEARVETHAGGAGLIHSFRLVVPALARPSQYRACFVLDEAVDIDPDGIND